jgi:ketopantoate reductase
MTDTNMTQAELEAFTARVEALVDAVLSGTVTHNDIRREIGPEWSTWVRASLKLRLKHEKERVQFFVRYFRGLGYHVCVRTEIELHLWHRLSFGSAFPFKDEDFPPSTLMEQA